MSKSTLFRGAMFGYYKSDVHAFLEEQSRREKQLLEALRAAQEHLERSRGFYESLLRVSAENEKVITSLRARAENTRQNAQKLSQVFASLSSAYRELYAFAEEQRMSLSRMQAYEHKAARYDELARNMKELVLPAEACAQPAKTEASVPVTLARVPGMEAFETLEREATGAISELNARVSELLAASECLSEPPHPEQEA